MADIANALRDDVVSTWENPCGHIDNYADITGGDC
jgi:hypothetical protein